MITFSWFVPFFNYKVLGSGFRNKGSKVQGLGFKVDGILSNFRI
jgi:hypothetical protein